MEKNKEGKNKEEIERHGAHAASHPIIAPAVAKIGGQIGAQLVDLILPPQALFRTVRGAGRGVRRSIGENEDASPISLSAQSWADVDFLDEPCCYICGFPFDFKHGPKALCGRCVGKAPSYDRARAAFAYNQASRALVLRFKHGGETEGVAMFARQMQRAGRHLLESADVLVPVPLHYSRRIKRRFNQSALLARALSKRTGIALDTEGLMRARATPSQGGQTASGRRRNVQGAFCLRPKADFTGKHVVLVDDVMATGATLESCARTLKRGGAKNVDALLLSRVVKPAAIPT